MNIDDYTTVDRKIIDVVYDIDHESVRSLKFNYRDYCYLYDDYIDTVKYIKNYLKKHPDKFSATYRIIKNKYGEFDYVEFIPVKYYYKVGNKDVESKGLIYNIDDIPNNLKCITWPGDKRTTIQSGVVLKKYGE